MSLVFLAFRRYTKNMYTPRLTVSQGAPPPEPMTTEEIFAELAHTRYFLIDQYTGDIGDIHEDLKNLKTKKTRWNNWSHHYEEDVPASRKNAHLELPEERYKIYQITPNGSLREIPYRSPSQTHPI